MFVRSIRVVQHNGHVPYPQSNQPKNTLHKIGGCMWSQVLRFCKHIQLFIMSVTQAYKLKPFLILGCFPSSERSLMCSTLSDLQGETPSPASEWQRQLFRRFRFPCNILRWLYSTHSGCPDEIISSTSKSMSLSYSSKSSE